MAAVLLLAPACTLNDFSKQADSGASPLNGGTRDPTENDSGADSGAQLSCRDELCPTSTFVFDLFGRPTQCCTDGEERCGFLFDIVHSECVEARQPGPIETGCPGITVAPGIDLLGCCADSTGMCGLHDSNIGIGCFDPTKIDLTSAGEQPAPRPCIAPAPVCQPDDPALDECQKCLQEKCCPEWKACENEFGCREHVESYVQCLVDDPGPAGCNFPVYGLAVRPAILSCVELPPPPFNPGPVDAGGGASDAAGDAGSDTGSDAGSDAGPGGGIEALCATACLGPTM